MTFNRTAWIARERENGTALFHALGRYLQALERGRMPGDPETADVARSAASFFSAHHEAEQVLLEWGEDSIRSVQAMEDRAQRSAAA